MVSVGDILYGKYQVTSVLQPGDFGQVFRVFNFGMGRNSVIKMVPAKDPTVMKELIEAYSAHLCNHDNVVDIYACEVAQVSDKFGALVPGIVMELEDVAAGSLQNAITSGHMPLRQSVKLIKDVLYAVQFAHSKQIIHGDIKPDNIFIGPHGAKLADFGLAKNNNLIGITRAQKSFYVTHGAPELFAGNDIDASSDIFAAGMTLYRAANNIVDWQAYVFGVANANVYLQKGTLIKKLGYSHELPSALRKIVNKACAPLPNLRFKSCSSFREALEKLRFQSEWKKVAPDQWVSDLPGRCESVQLIVRSKVFEVEYKLNGRRQSKHCAQLAVRRDADAFMHRIIAETTLA
ncbi:Serine/threonine protein kinase [Rhizobiales bacterium GAS191]|nr:Serine/threonine protein kinase [Rhizobiales bacterium GAS191]